MASEQINFSSAGVVGLVLDRPDYSLEDGAFSLAQDVRFSEDQIRNFPGWEDICGGSLTVDKAYYLQPIPTSGSYYWAVAGLNASSAPEICITTGTSKIDVTPDVPPTITYSDQWTGGLFNGISVLNNGAPNYPIALLDPSEATPKYIDLPYDATDTWRTKQVQCSVMRPFKNFLVAFDVFRDNARYPYMVKWSDPADPGFLPASWDETDPATLAGQAVLAETGGTIVEFAPLGDLGMIYKEDSVWSMSLVGGQYVFKFRQALASVGCLAPNCVTEYRGKHLVLTDGDIVIHNGQTADSIVNKRLKNYIFRTMDTDNYRNSFVVRHDLAAEIWVCYPSTGSYLPNVALVWNYRDDTWTVRGLPSNTAWMTAGVDITGQGEVPSDPWDGQPFKAWDDPTPKIWTDREYNPIIRTLISAGETGIQRQDSTNLYGGAVRTCQAERTGILLEKQDRGFFVRRVYPLADGDGPILISIGSQDAPGAPVTWDGPHGFYPGADRFINVRVRGKLLAWRVESTANISWSLRGWLIDYTPTGTQ